VIRTWPGQTKEEWMKEYERDKALTPEERERELNEFLEQMRQKDAATNRQEAVAQQNSENPFENYDHPNSLENSEATIIWIIVMAIATIFKGNWIIWIIATIIWLRYITRHKIKK
jgi:hypothetical protein